MKLGTLDFHGTTEGNFIMRKLLATSLFRSTMCQMIPIQIILLFKQIIYILPLWVITKGNKAFKYTNFFMVLFDSFTQSGSEEESRKMLPKT